MRRQAPRPAVRLAAALVLPLITLAGSANEQVAATGTDVSGSDTAGSDGATAATTIFADDFEGPDALITNEYASRSPDAPGAVVSPRWTMTSGSLFRAGGTAWTGPVDGASPDAGSTSGTGSGVFRAVARVEATGDVAVDLSLLPERFVDAGDQQAWDGFHILVEYRNEQEFYAVSALRRDGLIVIKRKTPGGSANGGSYTTLATASLPTELGRWSRLRVESVRRDATQRVTLFIDDRPVLEALDTDEIAPLPARPVTVGIRGDNLEFRVDDIVVTAID